MPTIESPPCPKCGKTAFFEVTEEELKKRNQGELIQVAFPKMSADDRERFVSGYCPPCWDEIFGDEE
jgi:predicted RNA-binding Zn-ribbon protein involved in translation (DUF1610 family)